MSGIYQRLSMKHLMFVALSFVVFGLIWMAVVWSIELDNIWMLPGIFLIISGIIKSVAVQIWVRVAKLGTDEHKPIKAL